MSQNFSIHRATPDDVETLMRLNFDLFQHEYSEGYSETHNRQWTHSEEGRKAFMNCTTNEDAAAWIAFSEQKLQVGYLASSYVDRSWRTGRVASLDNMYVEPEYRSQGIGAALVNEFKAWAHEKNAKILKVGAMADNTRAQDFYKKCGFHMAEVILETEI